MKSGARRGGIEGFRFEVALSNCPPLRGDNELGLTLNTANKSDTIPYMEELEIVVVDD